MTAHERLAKHLANIASASGATTGDCLRIFTLARELLEGRRDKNSYPTVVLYSNWLVHPVLDRTGAKRILQAVQTIFDRDAAGQKVDLVSEVSGVLAINRLRRELRQLLVQEGLPTFFVDSKSNWDALIEQILTDLIAKPLVGSDFTEEERRTGFGKSARKLSLVAKHPGHDAQIWWRIEAGPCVHIQGMLVGREPRSAFQQD
jgi:hypothetical protein